MGELQCRPKYKSGITQCDKRILNKGVKAFFTTFAGLKRMIQGFRTIFM